MIRPVPDLRVYLVLDRVLCGGLAQMAATAGAAARAGAGVVQLRDKDVDTAARIEAGRAIQQALAGTGAAFVMNDDVDAAIALSADGLHIGQGDMDPAEARARIGSRMLLGLSVETEDQARCVAAGVVDLVGAGPVFGTTTKPDHAAPCGLDGLARIVARLDVPAVAIGGLKRAHVPAVKGAGAAGLAVVSAICGQADPGAATASLVQAFAEVPA